MVNNKGAYFLKLEVQGFRCFGIKQMLDLSDDKGNWQKWNILLGDNGVGKTTLLQLLAAFEMEEIKDYGFFPIGFKNDWFKLESAISGNKKRGRANIEIIDSSKGGEKFEDGYPYLSFNGGFLDSAGGIGINSYEKLKCFGYGANRFMSSNSLTESKTKNSETLFSEAARLINAEEWLLQLDYASSKESEVQQYAAKKRDQVKEILLNLLPDIKELRFTTPTKENLKSTVEFATPYGWVTIHQLSLGYKTMVAWVVDLAARMFERYPDSENPLTEPAIVLVDEIDLHLHPKWQRKIFDYLDERFPKTQFIVTAHSPLVVQSAPKDANIVLLRREGDHVVIDQNIESVKNWRLDQILTSDLFGIDSARSPEIEKQMLERTVLLQKGKLGPKESTRLTELNKIAHGLPTADRKEDIEAMEIIRKAAEIIKNK